MRTEGRGLQSWILIYDLTFPISPFALRRRRHIIQMELISHRAPDSRTCKLQSSTIAPPLSGAKFIDFSHHSTCTHTHSQSTKWPNLRQQFVQNRRFIYYGWANKNTPRAITNFRSPFSFFSFCIKNARWHCMREKQFLMMPVFGFEPMCRQPSHQMRLIIFVFCSGRCTKETHSLHSRSTRSGASEYANGTSPFSSLSEFDTTTISFCCLHQCSGGPAYSDEHKMARAGRKTTERTITWIVHWNKSVEIPKATFDANSLVCHGNHTKCRYLPSNYIYDLKQCKPEWVACAFWYMKHE